MITISKQYTAEAAHQLHLEGQSAANAEKMFGKCSRLHGHSYMFEVTLSGPVTIATGMVLNYFLLDDIVKPIIDGYLDHHFLNDTIPDILPTSENLVFWFAQIVAKQLRDSNYPKSILLDSVRVKETAKTEAVWKL